MTLCGLTIASIFLVIFVIVIYRKKIRKKMKGVRVIILFDFNTVVLTCVHTHT